MIYNIYISIFNKFRKFPTTAHTLKTKTRRERIRSTTPLQNPTMSSPGVAQLRRGPEVAQQSIGEEPISNNENATQIVIDIVKAILAQREMSAREKNAWKHVRNAISTPVKDNTSWAKEALKNIQKEVQQIKGSLYKQQNVSNKPMTYAEAARAQKGTGGVGREVESRAREVVVLARRQRELVVKPGKETIEQKNRNGRTLVEEIQRGGAKEVVAARRLLSGDVVVTTIYIDARKEIQSAIS